MSDRPAAGRHTSSRRATAPGHGAGRRRIVAKLAVGTSTALACSKKMTKGSVFLCTGAGGLCFGPSCSNITVIVGEAAGPATRAVALHVKRADLHTWHVQMDPKIRLFCDEPITSLCWERRGCPVSTCSSTCLPPEVARTDRPVAPHRRAAAGATGRRITATPDCHITSLALPFWDS